MNKQELNLTMANAFEEIRSIAAKNFNLAYDGHTTKDEFISTMKWIKQMCDTRIDRIEACELESVYDTMTQAQRDEAHAIQVRQMMRDGA